jgi:hypothetical protein
MMLRLTDFQPRAKHDAVNNTFNKAPFLAIVAITRKAPAIAAIIRKAPAQGAEQLLAQRVSAG